MIFWKLLYLLPLTAALNIGLEIHKTNMQVDLDELLKHLAKMELTQTPGMALEEISSWMKAVKEAIDADGAHAATVSENKKGFPKAIKATNENGVLREVTDKDINHPKLSDEIVPELLRKALTTSLNVLSKALGTRFTGPCSLDIENYLYRQLYSAISEQLALEYEDFNGRGTPNNVLALGDYGYDQCLQLEQYCFVRETHNNRSYSMYDWNANYGLCLPLTCNEHEIRTFVEIVTMRRLTVPQSGCIHDLYSQVVSEATTFAVILIVVTALITLLLTIRRFSPIKCGMSKTTRQTTTDSQLTQHYMPGLPKIA